MEKKLVVCDWCGATAEMVRHEYVVYLKPKGWSYITIWPYNVAHNLCKSCTTAARKALDKARIENVRGGFVGPINGR